MMFIRVVTKYKYCVRILLKIGEFKMKKIKTFIFVLTIIFGINAFASTPVQTKSLLTNQIQTNTNKNYIAQNSLTVNPLNIVARPSFYLNKTVKIRAKFDKFSTLGLDYKPAYRSSENYITFLIQRPDVLDHNIPLSELKIFISRTEAEKYIELNSGDIVEFSGKVFSTALGDPWMDATTFTVISSKPKTDN